MTFKVANIISRFNSSSGGPPRTVSLIAQAGVGCWQAELFTSNYTESHSDLLLVEAFPGRVNFTIIGLQGCYGTMAALMGLSSNMRRQLVTVSKPDVVHLHGLWSPFLAAYAGISLSAGIPYIVAPHGMLEPWSLTIRSARKRFALKSYQGSILTRAAAIHTTSEAEADHVRRLGFTGKPIFVVPNAVDEPKPSADRANVKSPGAKSVLLFLSRVHEKKGLDNLLRAWNAIRPSRWELKIVGHGEPAYVAHLKQICTVEKIPDVEFHAHVDGDAREAMFDNATAFVLPTHSENFGNAVAEAMLRGLPVITTTGTPWSVLAERNLGWYIDPTREQLVKTLRELFGLKSGDLREMGDRARQFAKENLVISAVRPRLLEMYEKTLAQ
jgi:glycosyltransferase involved in cell wall biosynthesis